MAKNDQGDKKPDAAEESLFREIDEDLRHEKLEVFWKRWGSAIISGCIALVVGVAGWEIWQGIRDDALQEASVKYDTALATADPGQSVPVLAELSADGPGGYSMLSAFRRGAIAAQTGNVDAATAAFGEAASATNDEFYKDLSVLLTVVAEMRAGAVADHAALVQQLEPLAAPGRPWRISALELRAYLALQSGDRTRAVELFQELGYDETVPQTVRARAQNFAQYFADG